MEAVKYIFESYENRNLPEDQQGWAMVTLLSAADSSKITNMLVTESVRGGRKKAEIDYAGKSLQVNQKHCPKAFNVVCPLTDKKYESIGIKELFNKPEFKELYEELSNVVGDLSQLKEGLKKSSN